MNDRDAKAYYWKVARRCLVVWAVALFLAAIAAALNEKYSGAIYIAGFAVGLLLAAWGLRRFSVDQDLDRPGMDS